MSSAPSSASAASSASAPLNVASQEINIQHLEHQLAQAKHEASLTGLDEGARAIAIMERDLKAKKKEKAATDRLEALRAKHESFDEHPNEQVRTQLRVVREAVDESLCLTEGVIGEVALMRKEVKDSLFTKKKVLLDENDTVLYTKEEMEKMLTEQRARSMTLIASVIDLVHILDIKGKDVVGMQDQLAQMQYLHGKESEEKRRKTTHKKEQQREKDGCECAVGQCKKGMPGNTCHCFAKGGQCGAHCTCKNCANPYGGKNCANPYGGKKRADNIIMMDDEEAPPIRG